MKTIHYRIPIWSNRTIEKIKFDFYKSIPIVRSNDVAKINRIFKFGFCELCGDFHLNNEYSHIRKTRLNGIGRGLKYRFYDFIKKRHHYMLLCKSCHDGVDGRELLHKHKDIFVGSNSIKFLNSKVSDPVLSLLHSEMRSLFK